ncbi:semaphorin-3E isoform X2 [Rhinatrema bivittatum]|uniref:semaphorin-3E isoform X2 n=1 Tax=Rhinatrema bivittatum TaxID=194408 RepID=UPI0011279FC5|nr:semaphorin-3E isoform X2 [Rhinatrema bivittatum]
MVSARKIFALALCGLSLECLTGQGATDPQQPRLRLSHKELWDLNRTSLFHSPFGFLDLHSVLLDEYQERLFVGGRDLVYSLSLDQIGENYREIHWQSTAQQVEDCERKGRESNECANFVRVLHHYNRTHLLACGTGAFEPVCAFIRVGHRSQEHIFQLESHRVERGRGRCPFDPSSSFISTFRGHELFAGLYNDYWRRDGAIFRSMGRLPQIRTEHDDERLLKEPKFVASYVIPDNEDQNDDKVYFFFSEKALETDKDGHAIYARVGRLCANDVGGQRILVNKWSTFLKTRLICSVAGPNGIDTHFDELEDVFLLHTRDSKNPEIFALFSTTSNIFQGYAICVYHMASIRDAFNGPYAHKEGPQYHWAIYEGKIPYPRPGSCTSKVNGGRYESTKDYPDDVVRFARGHPLMYEPIKPAHKRPVLVKIDGKYSLKQIAVDRVEAEDGQYDVLFIGTDNGIVLKVITIYNKETESMEEVILEELQVFKVPVPIISMDVSVKRLYIGSKSGISQVKFHQCDMYGSACTDCCLARDPYCAWDGMTCSRYYPSGTQAKRRFRRQDIRHGNAIQQCLGQPFTGETFEKTEERLVYGVEYNSTLLECTPRSLQAKVVWLVQRANEARKEEVRTDERVRKMEFGLLFLKLQRTDTGLYFCQAVEHSFSYVVRKITLEVVEEERVDEMFHRDEDEDTTHKTPCPVQSSVPQASRPWYKEFLQLIGYSNFQRVEEYCEKVWCTDKKRKKLKMLPSKWKYGSPQERKAKSKPEHYRVPRRVPGS